VYIKEYISASKIKLVSIYVMSFAYVWIGTQHFIDSQFFMNIMPPYLPWHLELVYISGFFEILLGILLLIKKFRFYAGWGLILLLIAVYPANIYLAFNDAPQKLLDVSPFMVSWVRLPLQFVLIGIAYWHTKS
jgi:uncharacterized membrane protein